MADISSITLPGGGTYDLKDKNAQRKITVSGILKGDGQGGVTAATAEDVPYDNAHSSLTANNVQNAIDELAAGAGGGGVDPETIAPMEETATATIVHPLGSIFYFNDILYRAIEDIPVGGTINTATGGNATQTTIAQNFKRTVTLTSAEYAQLSIAEKTADIVYIITDDNSIHANDVNYNHETSGASAANVQDALDEAFSELGDKQPTITANGILKGDGQGGVSAATAGTDYQAPLTIDSTPTANSTNPVQSGGVYTDVRTRVPVYGMGKNLLDNAYFLNPVNQRGATSGVAGYVIDRWLASYGSGGVSWSLTSSGLTFQPTNPSSYGYICQIIGNEILSALTGNKISVYVLTSAGDMIGGIVTHTSNVLIYDSTYDGHRVRIRFSGNEFRIETFASALTVCAVKLELGSEQTLAHQENGTWVLNEIPDYEYELYRCMTSTADPTDTYANKSLATEQQLAYVETGTTATKTGGYTAGEYICWQGTLYTANTNIAYGITLSAGTGGNLTECVGGGFNSLSNVANANVTFSNNVTGYTYQNEYHLSKSGNVVTTFINMSTGNIAGMGTLLCTVPAAFRPSANRRIAAWLTYNGESRVDTVFISPSGEIATASGGYNVTGWIRVFGTYIL